MCDDNTIEPRHLNLPEVSAFDRATSLWRLDLSGDLGEARRPAVAEVERRKIEQALKNVGGNKRLAAVELGITFKTLTSKLREYGIPYGVRKAWAGPERCANACENNRRKDGPRFLMVQQSPQSEAEGTSRLKRGGELPLVAATVDHSGIRSSEQVRRLIDRGVLELDAARDVQARMSSSGPYFSPMRRRSCSFSLQKYSRMSVSGCNRCVTLIVNGFVYHVGSSIVISTSMCPKSRRR